MDEAIVGKLRTLLHNGITTEAELVYLLVEVRKLYERRSAKMEACPYLELFCDWAVHAKLDRQKWGDMAKELKDRLIAPEEFRQGLARVLKCEGLPEPADWPRVLQLLAEVLKDCPLEFTDGVQKIWLTVSGHGGGWEVTFRLIEPGSSQPRRRRCPPPPCAR